MLRLFIGIDLPSEIKHILHDILPKENGFKKTPFEQIHLTLRFLGDTPEESKKPIIDALKKINLPAFPISIHNIDCFMHKKIPQILWAGINFSHPLEQLKKSIDEALESLDFQKENRLFIPHITIARLKNISTEEIKPWLEHHQNFQHPEFIVHEYYLFSSLLSHKGATHIHEAKFLLKNI